MLQLIKDDPWLAPYENDATDRLNRYQQKLKDIEANHNSLKEFANAYHYFGIHYDKNKKGYWVREWAPGAHNITIFGDFNGWERPGCALTKNKKGEWEVFLSEKDFPKLEKNSSYKLIITSNKGTQDRIPAYARYVIQDEKTYDFVPLIKESNYHWKTNSFALPKNASLLIYEAHIGIAQEEESVGTYKAFEKNVLPRIKKAGYNCIQLMAIHEHPYYGSFGYHVSNFFAPSSRFGTPDELKSLIDTSHQMGIAVIMDIVHSHAIKNEAEGLSQLDGTDDQYFHTGARGYHEQWDSLCFNYGKEEVIQFLLSNISYWMKEFHFDGFRFDGVTSMLYHHHGMIAFDHYDKYFKDGVEWDAITYLQLANKLIHDINPSAISIAEDMSGMPGLCRPIQDGGIGFDYRLGMGIPDYWIKLLKHQPDEGWQMESLWNTLVNRRAGEKTVAYAESHDQAIVGDKTTAFWLMDKDMYFHMEKTDENLIIDRGIALHKLIRFITSALGGEAYMNFIGNEFGHPEWLDFPREGNNWSYQYARRQWSLIDNHDLKYEFMGHFDQKMIELYHTYDVLHHTPSLLNTDQNNHCIMFKRGELVFVFNFSPNNSIPGYTFFVPEAGEYELVLNSDLEDFGGFGRIDNQTTYLTSEKNGDSFLTIYLPNRTGLAFKRK